VLEVLKGDKIVGGGDGSTSAHRNPVMPDDMSGHLSRSSLVLEVLKGDKIVGGGDGSTSAHRNPVMRRTVRK
jgi:hypothetical protein